MGKITPSALVSWGRAGSRTNLLKPPISLGASSVAHQSGFEGYLGWNVDLTASVHTNTLSPCTPGTIVLQFSDCFSGSRVEWIAWHVNTSCNCLHIR